METADRKFCVCEFPDDEHFTNLEALIVQLGPKECLIPHGDGSPEQAALKKVQCCHPLMLYSDIELRPECYCFLIISGFG